MDNQNTNIQTENEITCNNCFSETPFPPIQNCPSPPPPTPFPPIPDKGCDFNCGPCIHRIECKMNRIPVILDRDVSAYVTQLDTGVLLTVEDKDGETHGTILNGLTAYEIAVKNGYEGSETEWLDSLIRASITNVSIDSQTGIITVTLSNGDVFTSDGSVKGSSVIMEAEEVHEDNDPTKPIDKIVYRYYTVDGEGKQEPPFATYETINGSRIVDIVPDGEEHSGNKYIISVRNPYTQSYDSYTITAPYGDIEGIKLVSNSEVEELFHFYMDEYPYPEDA